MRHHRGLHERPVDRTTCCNCFLDRAPGRRACPEEGLLALRDAVREITQVLVSLASLEAPRLAPQLRRHATGIVYARQ